MPEEEGLYDVGRKDRTTNDQTVSAFDRMRGELTGVAMFTKAATMATVEPVTGKALTYIVQTARQLADEGIKKQGDTIFVQMMIGEKVVQMALPPKVANTIARQREALSKRVISKARKAAAKERMEAGHVPFAKKAS